MLIHNKDDIQFVTEFPCFLGHPVVLVVWDLLYILEPTPMYTILTIIVGLVICTYQNQILRTVYYTYYTKLTNINIYEHWCRMDKKLIVKKMLYGMIVCTQ